MEDAQRKEIARWARDLIISVAIVPAILLYFQMTPIIIIIGGVAALAALKLWENWPTITLSNAIWSPTGKVHGWIGIVLLCVLICAGYVGSRWPTSFLRSSSIAPPNEVSTGPILSRLDHFILNCDVPPPAGQTLEQTFAALNEYKRQMDIIADAFGQTVTIVTIRGGIRVEIEAVTDEAKQRLLPWSALGVTKVTMEIRRVGQIEIVSALTQLPPQFSFFGLIAPNPLAADTILVRQRIEGFIGAREGACHIM